MMGQRIFPPDDVLKQGIYVCPACKEPLVIESEALYCQVCKVAYPIVDNIPDFIHEDLSNSASPVLRGAKSIDWLARIYESKLWYPLVLNLYGGWGCTSLQQLVDIIARMLGTVTGRILDVACGPGTFGRRIASQSRMVYGIDISMGMLQQGMAYTRDNHTSNIRFSRSMVEALPFEDGFFDGALCCGALHLFMDTVAALKEISRTMKAGAPLAVFTFTAGNAGILRFHRIREHVRQDHGVHVFEIPEIERYLREAGFTMFQPTTYGSVLMFGAIKCEAGQINTRNSRILQLGSKVER